MWEEIGDHGAVLAMGTPWHCLGQALALPCALKAWCSPFSVQLLAH